MVQGVGPGVTNKPDQKKMEPDRPERWKTLRKTTLVDALPFLRVWIEQIELPDGHIIDDYYQVYLPDSVLIFARDPEGMVVVERAYKHGLRQVSLVLPAGGVEQGEQPLEAARRELLEETGYRSDRWSSLGTFQSNANQGGGRIFMFEALNAMKIAEPESGDLEEIEIVLLADADLADVIRRREMIALSSVTACSLALNELDLTPYDPE